MRADEAAMTKWMLGVSDRLAGADSETSRWIRKALSDGHHPRDIADELIRMLKKIKREKGET